MAGASPRLRPGWPRDQRQRERFRRAAGARPADREGEAREHAALRVVGRRGSGPGRVDGVRERPEPGRTRPDRALPELRHGRVAELHPDGLRRRPVVVPAARRGADPAGSTAIEDVFESYYTMVGEPYDDTQFTGRSDYQAFIVNGIPSGGLFTGAEQMKTAEQQAIWGGTGRAVRPVLPPGLRHVRERQRPRARREQRPGRVRDAHVRLLDGGGQRRAGQNVPGRLLLCPRRQARKGRSSRRGLRTVDGCRIFRQPSTV